MVEKQVVAYGETHVIGPDEKRFTGFADFCESRDHVLRCLRIDWVGDWKCAVSTV